LVEVVVDSRIRILSSSLDEGVTKLLREAFTHKNPKRAQMENAKIRGWWNEPRLLPTWGLKGDHTTFPRGGMAKVRRILQENGILFRVLDRRVRGHETNTPDSRVTLWPHQERIVAACMKRENCLVKSSTGSGKTSALLALASKLKVDTLVVVHTTALMYQWLERVEAELGIPAAEVGIIGDGKSKIRELTVGTQKSIANMAQKDPEFLRRWGAVLVDEVHCFAARTFFACIDPFPARYRIGVSDDERRKDRLEFLIHDLFGEVAEEVSHEEMVAAGHVMDVEVYIVPTEFQAPWYDEAREEGNSPDYTRLLSEMAQDDARNAIVESILSRELALDHQCLVFTREREHCRILGAAAAHYARAGYLIGGAGADRQEFNRTRKGLRKGDLRVAVGTLQACGTGVDLPGVEVGVAALPILSNRQAFRQARGRICRKPAGKTTARFYVLYDQHVFGLSHLANAASWNSSTFVLDAGQWVPVRAYLKKMRASA
jgi:superfamily II DNA or RNA helicase